jgi:hypothetical protein
MAGSTFQYSVMLAVCVKKCKLPKSYRRKNIIMFYNDICSGHSGHGKIGSSFYVSLLFVGYPNITLNYSLLLYTDFFSVKIKM